MISQGRGIHCPTTHLATYPGSIPLPKGCSLPCVSPILRLRSLLPPDEPRHAYHRLGIIQVCLQADPLKNSYHCCQRFLNPYHILSCYPSVICVEADVVFPCQPPETVLSLLESTYLLKGCPDYSIHYDIKQCQGYRVSLCHPYQRAEGSPVVLP